MQIFMVLEKTKFEAMFANRGFVVVEVMQRHMIMVLTILGYSLVWCSFISCEKNSTIKKNILSLQLDISAIDNSKVLPLIHNKL